MLQRLLDHAIRRPALRGFLALAAAALAAFGAAAARPPIATPIEVAPVASGVFVHIGAIEAWGVGGGDDTANRSLVVGGRCVAVIDPGGTPEVGRALRAAVARATPLPVCFVIETHAHPDHVLGSVAFVGAGESAPKFVAAARFGATLAAREPYYLKALQRDLGLALTHGEIVYPTLAVQASLDLDLGGRVIRVQAWPTAHTDNDLTVYDLQTKTLFASDLLFVGHLPAVDGSLRGWVAVMGDLKRLDAALVVPGHGPVSRDWPAVMAAQSDYLNGLLRDTRAALRAGLTIQQAVDRIAVPPGWSLTDEFHRRNVTAAYAELEWEEDNATTPAAPARAASASPPPPGDPPPGKGRTP
jgi:quinoprotein relay system zinc metallohydrolase 2